jgi:hypothetical protein
MMPAERGLFDKIKSEARRVFGEECVAYYTGSPDEYGIYACEVMLRPTSNGSTFVLKTEGTELMWAFVDMVETLGRLAPNNG